MGVLGVLEAVSSPVLPPALEIELAVGEFVFCACWVVDVGPGAGRWLPKVEAMIPPTLILSEDLIDCVSLRAEMVLCGWPCAAAHAPGWKQPKFLTVVAEFVVRSGTSVATAAAADEQAHGMIVGPLLSISQEITY